MFQTMIQKHMTKIPMELSGFGYEWMEVLVALPKALRRVEALPLLSLGGRSILVIQLAFLHHQGMSIAFLSYEIKSLFLSK